MVRRLMRLAGATLILLVFMPGNLVAHSGGEASGISVEPSSVTAGGTVVLAGKGLEPESERQLDLVGPDMIVTFPTATTDADGMFSTTLTIPAHLPAGTYTLQAIADETMTTELTVTAAAGQAAAPEPANEAAALVVARSRSGVVVAAIAIFVVVAAAAGLLLVVRAERFGRPS